MVELVKKNLQLLRVKSKASNQLIFDEDYNVPDAKPDVGRMIQNKGDIRVEEVKLNDHQAYIRAKLIVELLYVADTQEGKVYNLEAAFPIEETLNLDQMESGDKICLKWDIEDLSLHIINSRKLNVKSMISFFAAVDEMAEAAVPIDVSGEGISMKKQDVRIMNLAIHKKDTVRLKEEVTLSSNKPNISQVLWKTVDMRSMDLRAEDDRVTVKGELFVFVLYAGTEEEQPLQWLEYAIPVHGEVECTGCTSEMLPNIEVTILQQGIEVKPDADGEERLLQVDMVLELDMKIYEEQEYHMVLDVYTPLAQCIPKSHPEVLENLLVRNFSRCKVNQRVKVREVTGKVLQVCHSQGNIRIDHSRIIENGIQAEGVIQVKILYIVGDDHMPFYSMEAMIPFSHKVEAVDIREDCVYHLRADLEQLSTTMMENNEIEIKAAINLNALVLRRKTWQIIDEIEEQPLDKKQLQSMPGITVYMVQPEDTLWDIAKTFCTTVEDICETNGLEEEKVQPYQPLLLVKKVENW